MSSLHTLSQGLLAGLTGSAVMHGFRFLWEEVTHHRRKDAIFGFDYESDVNAARLLSSWFRGSLPERQAARLGIGLHYTYGAALGLMYAVARDRNAMLDKAHGVPLGVVLWVCADEIPITVSGISNPLRKSAASHIGALLAHLVFAMAVDATLRLCQHDQDRFVQFWKGE